MTTRKTSWLGLATGLLLALLFPPHATSQTGTPIPSDRQGIPFAEAGNWWDIARPGEGLVLERQGTMAGVILFTYTASGEPDFYLATAPLASLNMGAGTPTIPIIGAARSATILEGALIRFKNGPILNSDRRYFEGDPPASETEAVGRIRISMWPYSNALSVGEFNSDSQHC